MEIKRKKLFLFKSILILLSILICLWPACRKTQDVYQQGEEAETTEGLISLSASSQKFIGLKTEAAERREYIIPLRAAGRIDFNPKAYAVVVARCSGRVEKILAYEGDAVEKGQELIHLYSPEHQALQAEYLQTLERMARPTSTDKEMLEKMLDSIRRRLHFIGVDDEQIKVLGQEKRNAELLAVRSPLKGRVISRSINNGEYVETGREFFRIADLSLLWIEVNIFEKDLAKLTIPSDCEVRVEAYPEQIFKGKITLLADVMDEATRTFRLRAEVRNPDFRLKPGMYVDVYLWPREREKILAVPEKALRRLEGEEALFVQSGPESFSLRPVKIGRSFDGLVEILDGLKEGETYVTEGSFALKSEAMKKILEGEGHEHKH